MQFDLGETSSGGAAESVLQESVRRTASRAAESFDVRDARPNSAKRVGADFAGLFPRWLTRRRHNHAAAVRDDVAVVLVIVRVQNQDRQWDCWLIGSPIVQVPDLCLFTLNDARRMLAARR